MRKQHFLAQELYCMAYLAGKKKMYGIPAAFGNNRRAEMQDTIDDLLKQQIAEMDIDGKIRLSEAYKHIADIISDCNKCITVNIQNEDETTHNYIFWRCQSEYFMAEVIDYHYVLSKVDAELILGIFEELRFTSRNDVQGRQCVIPQIILTKAKRLCMDGRQDDAVRLLRQNGANEEMAAIIAEGLSERAHYVGILLMEVQDGVCQKKGGAFLSAKGMVLSPGQTVENYRTCITFNEVPQESVNKAIREVVDAFLYE